MTEYYVTDGKNYTERFYNLTDAKKAMKEHGARGYKTKIYANGDFCGLRRNNYQRKQPHLHSQHKDEKGKLLGENPWKPRLAKEGGNIEKRLQ